MTEQIRIIISQRIISEHFLSVYIGCNTRRFFRANHIICGFMKLAKHEIFRANPTSFCLFIRTVKYEYSGAVL